jgi:drug/metabolite transporter (DMT)-like permease
VYTLAVTIAILALFLLSLSTNILGPLNLKIMSQLDVEKELVLFLSLALVQILIVSTRMVTWFKILRKVRLSIAYPIVSITFPIMLFISNRLFDETVTIEKIAGTLLIVAGILVNHYKNA